jgi:hypothetical protein
MEKTHDFITKPKSADRSSADPDFSNDITTDATSFAPPTFQLKAGHSDSEEKEEKSTTPESTYQLAAEGIAPPPDTSNKSFDVQRALKISVLPTQLKTSIDQNEGEEKEEKSTTPESSYQLAAEGIAPPPDTPNDEAGDQSKPNNTGLPNQLKSGVENLSGFSLDDVKVHYNSDKPAQLQAHAYAQGSDIHVASGQEKHLPHEAWHVVQQKQGRVQPTRQLKAFNINDDKGLEKEADVMGAKALQLKQEGNAVPEVKQIISNDSPIQRFSEKNVLQQKIDELELVPKTMLAGILDTNSPNAAIQKIYRNMFAYGAVHWKYQAGHPSGNAGPLISGAGDVGMCETYRNAFKTILEDYARPIFEDYEPLSAGFEIQLGQELVNTDFVTNENLSLLGRSDAYNVTHVLDASTGAVTATKRYLFTKHWQLVVNGATYDPLFEGANQNNIAWTIEKAGDRAYKSTEGDIEFLANPIQGPPATGEFDNQYIQVNNMSLIEEGLKNDDFIKGIIPRIVTIRDHVVNDKATWAQKKDDKFGKSRWRKKTQKDRLPRWRDELDSIKEALDVETGKDAPEAVLGKVSKTLGNNLLSKCRFGVRRAFFALNNLIDEEKMSAMDFKYDEAIKELNDCLDQRVIKDVV